MKKILLLLTLAPTLCLAGQDEGWKQVCGELSNSPASGQLQTITINGSPFDVQQIGTVIYVDGPGGFHASGIRLSNGNIDLVITDPGALDGRR